MATYVMSDIHGCFDDFQKMLEKIGFSAEDQLILAGDYIDRGRQDIEMLQWLYKKPANVTAIKGNHDVEYCGYIDLMKQIDESENLHSEYDLPSDTELLYHSTTYALDQKNPGMGIYFDYYKSLERIVKTGEVSFNEMLAWRDMLDGFPYFVKKRINHRDHIIVHAGYCEDVKSVDSKETTEDFYIYARETALKGGIRGGVIISGHTPTVIEYTPFYTGGRIFSHYNEDKDCLFYNIDGGCSYRGYKRGSRLICLRLEDAEVFYV